jgi:tRNA(fMet)-specific endonuclease VapC
LVIYLPDTNAVSVFLTARDTALVERMTAELAHLRLSLIVIAERGYGIIHHASGHRYRQRYDELLRLLPCEPFTREDAVLYASIRSQLERRGQGIGPLDTLIAAQALRLDATVVTRNVAEFTRVPGLKVEDWQTS